ncbi:MAG: EamA family transporter [Opitutae bacterium]|nr:EamA family transporter [Opitutae bacterium]
MSSAPLPVRHLLLALLVVAIWGCNFVVIKLALRELPPLLLCTLRFVFVSVPLVFFLPRPAVPLRRLLVYGCTMFAGQFGFLFLGMKLGMPAGLASLVLQVQVFVTLTLAAVALKERVSPVQIAGALVAIAGFVVVAMHTGGEVTAAGLTCVLLAALSWGYANFTSKRLGRVNPLALVAWGSLVVPVPMAAASALFEGPAVILRSLAHLSGAGVLCVGFIVYISTVVAFSLWSWLLARHPASAITPFALLVPIFGLLSSALALGEPLPGWKLQAGALVIAGLALNIFGPRLLHPAPAPDTA